MKMMAIAGTLVLALPALAQDTETKVGSWTVKKTVDSFSDAKRGISNTAMDPAKGIMLVKCDKPGAGSLYVSFLTPTYLGSDRIRAGINMAKFRLDEDAPEALPRPRYDGRAAHLFDANAEKLLTQIIARKPTRIRVQFVTYDSNYANVDIDIAGAADAIRQTAVICEDPRFQ